MGDVRTATLDDVDAIVRVCSAGFFDDPLMRWVFDDDRARLGQLQIVFGALGRDYLSGRGVVHVLEDGCAALWREPGFEHHVTSDERTEREGDRAGDDPQAAAVPADAFPPEALERLGILGAKMVATHPHDRHWYLHVVSTEPARQGQGLGARTLAPVLQECDTTAVPAYLESSNARNLPFYKRLGFEQIGEITLPDGPSLYPMWRSPR